jgi:hypothetical protein
MTSRPFIRKGIRHPKKLRCRGERRRRSADLFSLALLKVRDQRQLQA